ncbi:MAG TPA: O-antigen ligase family protein [Gemmatimonadaceae bacterium]
MSAGADGIDVPFAGLAAPQWWRLPRVSGAFIGVTLLFLALNIQMLTFSGHLAAESDAGAGPALKVYHGLFGCFGLLLLARGRLVRWRPEMIAYFVVVGLTALVASYAFGPKAAIANMIFAGYAATVGGTIGLMAGPATTLRALRWVSVAVLLAVLVKGVIFLPDILRFLAAPYGHPTLPTFYGGGPNVEATWVAMSGVFLIGSRLFIPYMIGSAGLSVAYASRVGLIIVVLVVVASVGRSLLGNEQGIPGRRWLLPVAVILISGLGVFAARGVQGADYIAQRFQSVGEDPGSTSRLALWTGGVRVFVSHPLGVGLGNAVPMVERTLAANVTEDNLHNQWLQQLVESGAQGFCAYILLIGLTWRRAAVSRLRDPLLLYIGIYFVIALLQFRGTEALLWFAYGLQSGAATPEGMHAA